MCFQMYYGGVGFPRISYRCSMEFLRIFYGLSTQPHAFTVLTTKETGRHRLLWRTNTVANNQGFQESLFCRYGIQWKPIKHQQEIHSNSAPYALSQKYKLIEFWIICYGLLLPPISPTHRGHCLGKACVYREPRRQRLLHGPVVWARAPRYSLLLFHKGIAAGPRAEPLLLLHKGIATRPRAEPISNIIDNLMNKK